MRRILVAPGLALLMLFCATAAPAQSTWRIDVSGGAARDNTARIEDFSDWGFDVGLSAWFVANQTVQLGLRFGYVRWTPDKGEVSDAVPIVLTDVKVKGDTDIWEFLPSIRIGTPFGGSPIGIFGQFGAGLYVWREEAKAEGTAAGVSTTVSVVNESSENFGFNAGFGVKLGTGKGFGLELLPLYNIVSVNGDPRQYYTLNMGISYTF